MEQRIHDIYATPTCEVTQRERKHMDFARKLAAECVVLLENDGTLPLRSVSPIALYGNGARQTVKGGTGSGDVYSRSVTTIEQGLRNAGFTVLTDDWLARFDEKRERELASYQQWVPKKAAELQILDIAVGLYYPPKETAPVPILPEDIKDAEAAIYVISRSSGEGSDCYTEKGDYHLFDEELDNLRTLVKAYRKVIVLLNVGRVIDLKQLREIQGINAIILMGQLGNVGGDAIVDVLLGHFSPSGKLTDTWAFDYADYPSADTFSHNNGNVKDEYYTEGIYVGYRYFDTVRTEPMYCFGYGKSYTDFELDTKNVTLAGEQIQLSVLVKNAGKEFTGKEVVQIYCSAPPGKLDKPYQQLVDFGKTRDLEPGESQTLKFSFSVRNMASYSQADAAWILERGKYILRVGNSSQNTTVAAVIDLGQDVKTAQLKNAFSRGDFAEFVPEHVAVEADAVQTLKLDASLIQTRTANYQAQRKPYSTVHEKLLTVQDIRNGYCTVEELVSQLSVEELAAMCVGTSRADEADANIVGGASDNIPGAAGETASILHAVRGIRGLIFADGPAGLRLKPHFRVSLNGAILPDDDVSTDAKDYYQYCTALPIGWSLAQSWNTGLLEQAGDMVGAEMDQFHIDLWLAPAMNIHRNPLCGRNFEYYSEDPLISGKMAAAITRGVQRHPGKGTTLKHFAANNAEDNRYFQNTHISERALREIYLKGFEIAVTEAQPFSIMTAYNLINGTHAANNYALLQSVLRDEWGFQGFVMTDWFSSQDVPGVTGKNETVYPIASSTGCCFAGNDLQMPGCEGNVRDLVQAVETKMPVDGYAVSLADLQQCAANIIRVALQASNQNAD